MPIDEFNSQNVNAVESDKSVDAAEKEEMAQTERQHSTILSDQGKPSLVIITGMSGAGRTEAMHVFEDFGYYCIDNLPASLLTELVKLRQSQVQDGDDLKIAVVCDARNREFFGSLKSQIEQIAQMGIDYRILFLDASDEKLISRYKSSRRRHPMCNTGETIAQGIQKEREFLYYIHETANVIIDTSDMMPQLLRTQLQALFTNTKTSAGMNITVYSFGFKNGAPVDADVVIDVRFLPNPYWDPTMRKLSGLDSPVHDFVMARDETKDFLTKWYALLDSLIPGYIKEGKQQLAIGIGCTGGQHRSVTICEATGEYLKSKGYRVSVAHRDLEMQLAQANSKNTFTAPGQLTPGMSGRIPRINAGNTGNFSPYNPTGIK